MRPFEFLLSANASRQLLDLSAGTQRAALRAVEILADHPFTSGLPHWTDADGHENYLRFIHGWAITFCIDQADRKVRIIDFIHQ